MDRLNPVTLISGAVTGISPRAVRDIAHRSTGGLLLVDADDGALAALADDLESHNAAPERLSTLALDHRDEARWAQAVSFIGSQYGRLDWAVLTGFENGASDLVQFGQPNPIEIEGVAPALNAVMSLMRQSASGGAIVLSAAAMSAGLPQSVRTAAAEAGRDRIKLNAVAPGDANAPAWADAPWFNELVRETGDALSAFEKLASLPAPIARCASADDIARLVLRLLSDEISLTGATLLVDGGYTL